MALTYVGGYHAGTGTGSSDVTLTSLTGGVASSPSAGDLVIVMTGNSRNTDYGAINTSGYTVVADLYSNSSDDTNLICGYKVMGGTPDTVVNVTGSVSTSYSALTFISVWRGFDTVSPLDATTTTVTAINSNDIDPPSITPVTTGAYVVTGGLCSNNSAVTLLSTPTGYTSVTDDNGGSTSNIAGFIGYKAWTSGAENPSACSASSSGSGDSYASMTIAIRPALATFTLAETLALSEVKTFSIGKAFTLSETTTLTEVISFLNGKIFSILESVSLSERILGFQKWVDTVKSSTNWTNSNKSSAPTWSEDTKSSTTWTETDKS